MPINSNIALGVQPIQIADPMARYSQLAGIQNAQNQNALAQYQLNAAQRADEQQNKLYEAAQQPGFKLNFESAIQYGAPGIAAFKAQEEAAAAGLTREKTQADIKKTGLETSGIEFKQKIDKANKAISDIAALNSPQEAITSIDQHLANGDIDQQKADMLKNQLAQAPSFGAWQKRMLVNILDAKDRLTTTAPKPIQVKRSNGSIIFLDENPNSPTFQKEVMPSQAAGMTPYEQNTLNANQARFKFDQQKFAWEKANPGYTIQQAEDGSIVGVNNRTLQAFPVTLNAAAPPPTVPFTGVAPAVAPAPSAAVAPGGAGKRGGIVDSATTQPIQPIIQPRGEPLKGKSAGLTESQGNATAYGMRMKESHGLLKDLENKGETGTGVIRGTVGGVVGLVPLIGDKLTAGTDNIFTVLPSILGGMSPEQQQIQNARINFITAVLRKESGAAISPGEFITAEKLYFPQPGNDPSVIKQKQKARELAIKAMEIQAGPGAKSIQGLTLGTLSENKNVVTHPNFPGFSIGQ